MQHQPRKRFGQNFLQDNGVIADIVAAIRPSPGDKVVEIGPGLGALTVGRWATAVVAGAKVTTAAKIAAKRFAADARMRRRRCELLAMVESARIRR